MWNYKVMDNHPEGNGHCKRFNRTVLVMLRTLSESQKSKWRDHLQKPIFAYNSTHHESTGFSPYYLLFGRNSRHPVDIIFDNAFPSKASTHQQYIEEWQRAMNQAREIATQKARKARTQGKFYYVKKVRSSVLKPGDRGPGKLRAYWENDVYMIKRRSSEDSPVYCIAPESGKGKERIVHRDLLLSCLYLIFR